MHRESSQARIWGTIFILIGVFLLLRQFIDLSGFICPAILIGIGAYILFGNRQRELKTGRFDAPVDGATSARVKLNLSAGTSRVFALSDPETLIDAELTYLGEIEFSATGGTEKEVILLERHKSYFDRIDPLNWFGKDEQRLRWDVGLNPNLPTELTVKGGVGSTQLDLSELQLTMLSFHSGAGRSQLDLPSTDASYTAQIANGVGELAVRVPSEAVVGMSVQGGVGRINLTIGSDAAVNAHLKGGVGEMIVNVPGDAAVRVEGKTGLGAINTPAHFDRLASSDHVVGQGGVWETPGFDEAARKTTLIYEGGVGGLSVRRIK